MKKLLITIVGILCSMHCIRAQVGLPNILWITSEDNSPLLGCYGDGFAVTPNLDALAGEGFLYTRAYANAPVCAPARNTIITGVYANSAGNQHMRSEYHKSDKIIPFPVLLKQNGYYCTNNSKEDYNVKGIGSDIWDASSETAHYKNRGKDQPFFAVFNIMTSHESRVHEPAKENEKTHDPAGVMLPPYHPNTKEIREDWAHYYDQVTLMDKEVGRILKELEASGEADNTIVFYFSDHGGVIARSKRYVYETGTQVPMIVRIPDKFKQFWPKEETGTKVNSMVSFVDLAPTVVTLAEATVPDFLQGNAFLGRQQSEKQYAYMFRGRMDERPDMSRAVRDSAFRYIRNYMPHRIYGQHLAYLWRAQSTRSWEKECTEGRCKEIQRRFWEAKPAEELYQTASDPWEVNNLAENPEYKEVLERMRKANEDWMVDIRDAGLIPEMAYAKLQGDSSLYNYMRSGKVDISKLMEATKATMPNASAALLTELINSPSPELRYWGALGLVIKGRDARPYKKQLFELLNDESKAVAVQAAEALYNIGVPEKARKRLIGIIGQGSEMDRVYALNVIDFASSGSKAVQLSVITMLTELQDVEGKRYDKRMGEWLVEKWNVDVAR